MTNNKMSAADKRFQAEYDADTMARYEEIMGSATRRAAAIKVAKARAADLNKRAAAMNKVANQSKSKKK